MKSTLRSIGLALVLGCSLAAAVGGCGDATDGSDALDATERVGRFELFKGEDAQHYFQLFAANGEQLLRSEGYTSLSGAKDGIESVQQHGTNPDNFAIVEAQNGQHYFTLQALNGEIIGRGELYVSKYHAERGAETVRRIIRELTAVLASDDDIRTAVEAAAEGAEHMSEAEYPYTWVHAVLDGEKAITEELVREELAPYVDAEQPAKQHDRGNELQVVKGNGAVRVTNRFECRDLDLITIWTHRLGQPRPANRPVHFAGEDLNWRA